MRRTELITRARELHRWAGCNPDNYKYKESLSISGQKVIAHEIGTQASYPVAFYNSKSGRVVTPLRLQD